MEIKVKDQIEDKYTVKSGEVGGIYKVEVPEGASHVTLQVVSRVNHFKDIVVEIANSQAISEDDSNVIIVPEWKMSSMSMCGNIRLFDSNLDLHVLKPEHDDYFNQRDK